MSTLAFPYGVTRSAVPKVSIYIKAPLVCEVINLQYRVREGVVSQEGVF